jgi:[heparan sulfate]-glucosamine 3-sulfotransferase 1/[heparan sulfate]-glucosamine 3-sulfotransferase 5
MKKYKGKKFDDIVIGKKTGKVNVDYEPLQRSFYDERFQPWLQHFPLKQFLIIDGDEFIRKNPATVMKRIESFMGAPNYITKSMFQFNAIKGYFCPTNTGCLEDKGHPHPKPTAIKKLKELFKPHNEKFYNMVGIDFKWH